MNFNNRFFGDLTSLSRILAAGHSKTFFWRGFSLSATIFFKNLSLKEADYV